MPKKQYDYIALGMPMPIDLFATLGDLIEKAWPGSMLITDLSAADVPEEVRRRFSHTTYGGSNLQIVKVPRTRAKATVTKKEAQEVAQGHAREADLDESRLNFHGFSETGAVQMSGTPEELQLWLGAIGKEILDGAPEGAINYLEWDVIDKPSGTRTTVCVARSKGQTAHALRRAAEGKVERALEQLARAYANDNEQRTDQSEAEIRNVIARTRAALEGR